MKGSLLDRIEYVLEKTGLGDRNLGEAIKGRGLVTALRKRLKKNPNATISVPVADKLSKFAKVEFKWLCIGEGLRDEEGARPILTFNANAPRWAHIRDELRKRTKSRFDDEQLNAALNLVASGGGHWVDENILDIAVATLTSTSKSTIRGVTSIYEEDANTKTRKGR